MLSRYIIFPFGIAASILGVLAFYLDNGNLAIWAIVCVIIMIGVYFFSDAIDWWWFQDNPPKMDEKMKALLNQRLSFYQHLSVNEKRKFESRIELFIRAKEYIPNGWKRVPYDIQVWVAACAVMLTFQKDDYLLNDFERIVIYPHSFPSPLFPKQFHASEVFQEDGVVLFSSEKLLPGVMQPKKYFNIGSYEYAKVFQIMNPSINYPEMDDPDWLNHTQIVGYTRKKLEDYLGLDQINDWGVLACLFLSHPEEMESSMYKQYSEVKSILNY